MLYFLHFVIIPTHSTARFATRFYCMMPVNIELVLTMTNTSFVMAPCLRIRDSHTKPMGN